MTSDRVCRRQTDRRTNKRSGNDLELEAGLVQLHRFAKGRPRYAPRMGSLIAGYRRRDLLGPRIPFPQNCEDVTTAVSRAQIEITNSYKLRMRETVFAKTW